jgi:hypothetical protein
VGCVCVCVCVCVYVCAHAYTGVCVNVQVGTTCVSELYDVYRVLISV